MIDVDLIETDLPEVMLGQPTVDLSVRSLVLGVEQGSDGPRIVGTLSGLSSDEKSRLERLLPSLAEDWDETVIVIPAPVGTGTDLITLVGLGCPPSEPTASKLRRAAGSAARAMKGVSQAVVALPCSSEKDVAAIVEGALLGSYVYRGSHGSGPTPTLSLRSIHILGAEPSDSMHTVVRIARETARAVHLTRNLVNLSPDRLYPESFAALANQLASSSAVTSEVWDAETLAHEGFGGLVGVGQGSSRGPRLVRLDYRPAAPRKHLALVGKGITFDSGGINLKTSELDYMNFDMSGAAAVMSTVLAAAQLGLPVQVTAWLALAENMPSGTSLRPTDVLTIRDGTTVEVRDTDAEGRLVLADAIVAACFDGPDVMVDIATLTGAQQVALGNRISGLMSNDEVLSEQILRITDLIDEPAWRMPLPQHLERGLRSNVADIANKADRPGGMLTAALFLQHFVNRADTIPAWAHLDVCGPAINRGDAYGFTPVGATGVGVRTLLALAVELGA